MELKRKKRPIQIGATGKLSLLKKFRILTENLFKMGIIRQKTSQKRLYILGAVNRTNDACLLFPESSVP